MNKFLLTKLKLVDMARALSYLEIIQIGKKLYGHQKGFLSENKGNLK